MTSAAPTADQVILALRSEHDSLAAVARSLSDSQLTGPSGAADWTVAQVLSHLGSGSEIMLAGLQSGLGEREAPGNDFNQSVWDRWNALSPVQQRDGYLEHDARLLATVESLSAEQRDGLRLPIGFLPDPLSVAAFTGLRLNELAQHSWDARVGVEPGAEIDTETAAVLLGLFAGELGFLLGFVAKADRLETSTLVDLAGSGYGVAIADTVAILAPVGSPSASFTGPLGAAVRLLEGRLGPAHTPSTVTVRGDIGLDGLRAVFPGF